MSTTLVFVRLLILYFIQFSYYRALLLEELFHRQSVPIISSIDIESAPHCKQNSVGERDNPLMREKFQTVFFDGNSINHVKQDPALVEVTSFQ